MSSMFSVVKCVFAKISSILYKFNAKGLVFRLLIISSFDYISIEPKIFHIFNPHPSFCTS